MKVLRVVFCALVFGLAGSAAAAPDIARTDPGGYQGAKWGMTKNEVKAAFPKSTKWRRGKSLLYENLGVSGKRARYFTSKIADVPCVTVFMFDTSDRLYRVVIHPQLKRFNTTGDVQLKRMLTLLEAVSNELVEQYGAPASQQMDFPDVAPEIQFYNLLSGKNALRQSWSFPTTRIDLRIMRNSARSRTECGTLCTPLGQSGALNYSCTEYCRNVSRFEPFVDYRRQSQSDEQLD